MRQLTKNELKKCTWTQVSPPVLLGEPQDDAKVNIYILGLTKYTVTYVPGFFYCFSLCSYYAHFPDYKNYFKGEMVQPRSSFLFGERPKFGSVRRRQTEKTKRLNAICKQHKCLYVDNTAFISLSPDISFYLDKIHR